MKRGNSNAVGIVTLVTLGGVQCSRDARWAFWVGLKRS